MNTQFLQEAYTAGAQRAIAELEKTAGQGIGLGGAIFGPFAGLGADDGKGWSTAGGAFLGKAVGALGGQAAAGMLPIDPRARAAIAAIPNLLGGYLGARWGHGDYDRKGATLFGS